MTSKPSKLLACIVSITVLISVPPMPAQTPPSDSTVIPGIVEPLELTGDPQPLVQPSELDRRLANLFPKGENPEELATAKETLDAIIKDYPDSAEALSTRVLLLCEMKSKDAPVTTNDIDEITRLQKATDDKEKPLLLQTESELGTIKAKVEFDSGNHKKAVNDLYAAISVNVHDDDNVLNAGTVNPENKSEPCKWNKPDLDQLVKEYPADYRVYLFRGLYYVVFARLDDANARKYGQQPVADYGRAALLNPKSPLPPYFLGRFYMGSLGVLFGTDPNTSEKQTKALAAYDRAVQIDPHFTPAYIERAGLYLDLKQFQEAIKNFDKVIEASPKEESAYHDRGVAKLNSNDFYGAISDFTSALDNKLADPKLAYENRADAYVKIRNYENAIKDLTQAIKIYFGDEIFLMNLAQVKRLYPEYRNVPDDALLRKLHLMFFRNMEYDTFAKQLTDVNPKRGDFDTFLIPDLLVKRGDTYLMAGDYRRAVTDYQRATSAFTYGKSLDRWHLVSKGSQELYIDSETAEFDDPNLPKFWVKLVDTAPTAKGAYAVEQYAVDCRLKKINLFSFLKYDAKGNVTSSSDSETGWASTVPDSFGEQLYRGVCHQ